MKERIFKHWKTSILGLILIVGSCYMRYCGKFETTESIIFIVAGLGLMGIKDPFKK